MPENDLSIRIVQTLGVTTSAFLAGYITSASFAVVPRLLESPTPLLLKQWTRTYLTGMKSAPPLAGLSAACYFYLAYSLPSNAQKSKVYGYLAAGLLTVGIVPYTLAVIRPTNEKLLAKAKETKTLAITDEVVEIGQGNETAHKLVDNWGVLNLGRAVMVAAASMVGLWTVVN